MNKGFLIAIGLLVTALFGCSDKLTGETYKGEKLKVLQGNVIGDGQDALTTRAQIVLSWRNSQKLVQAVDKVELDKVELPAKFSLDIFSPPVDAVVMDMSEGGLHRGEPRLAFGALHLMRADFDLTPYSGRGEEQIERWNVEFTDAILGGCETHAVVYAQDEVRAGTRTAAELGAPLAAGFHIVEARWPSEADHKSYAECLERACPGLNDRSEEVIENCDRAAIDACTPPRVSYRVVDSREAPELNVRIAGFSELNIPYWSADFPQVQEDERPEPDAGTPPADENPGADEEARRRRGSVE